MNDSKQSLKLFLERLFFLDRLSWPILIHHLKSGNWISILSFNKKLLRKFLTLLLSPLGFLFVLIIRAIRPWFLIRINVLTSERIGHFAANTELYLCEHDAGINVPEGRYVDLWYHNWPVCNQQLARMWNRVLHVGPRWLLTTVNWVNSSIPGGEAHIIGNNTQSDIDVYNLFDQFPPHLSFLPKEVERGEAGLRVLGIPEDTPFVCLIVRDSSYLEKTVPWRSWSHHDYRDCNIQNYLFAAQKLAERGYYVVRMGAVVREAMAVEHPMIIDYAAKELRSDFMDIYLGAKCTFCISNSTGFDAVPYIFRRPILYVDIAPLGPMRTDNEKFISIPKKYWLRKEERFMTFREIFSSGAGYFTVTSNFDDMGIELVESTPEEIEDVVHEMVERLEGSWKTMEEDEKLQRRFWELFPENERHGKILSRMGTDFLRRHKDWLE